MAYIDVLGRDNYGEYNRTIAQIAGLDAAVYLGELVNILFKVRAKKTDNEGWWDLKRPYITERTTLTTEEQQDCDMRLITLGIIEIKNKKVKINNDMLLNILVGTVVISEEQREAIKNLSKSKLAEKSEAKQEVIINRLTDLLSEQDEELKAAYKGWIRVVRKKGYLTGDMVKNFEEDINNNLNNKQDKLATIKFATQTGYTVVGWCLNNGGLKLSQAKSNLNPTTVLPDQKVFDGDLGNCKKF